MTMKLKKGDRVKVLTGKDRGSEGEIMRVITKHNKVIVDGVNVAKKHQKPVRATTQAGIIDRDMPIPVSNVALICSSCGTTRVGFRFNDMGEKVRICRKCGGEI